MVIKGKIKTVKRIRYKNQECEGITKANKQSFLIRVVYNTLDRGLFPEVLLHELIHLWYFICFSVYGLYLSEREQHRLMNRLVPKMSSSFMKLLKQKGKSK